MNEREIYEKLAKGQINKNQAMEMIMALLENTSAQFLEKSKSPAESSDNNVSNRCHRFKNTEKIMELLYGIIENILHVTKEEIDVDAGFKDLGVDSINGVEIIRDINRIFNLNLDTIVLYDYYNLTSLSEYILKELEKLGAEVYEDNKTVNETEVEAEMTTVTAYKGFQAADGVKESLLEILSDLLHIHVEEIDDTLSFKDMGVDSINGVEIMRDTNKVFNLNLDTVMLYDYPNVSALAGYISEELRKLPGEGYKTGKVSQKNIEKPIKQKEERFIINVSEHSERTPLKIKSRSEEVPLAGLLSGAEGRISLKSTKTPIADKHQQMEKEYGGIAVIGMSGRFPGARNLGEFWNNLEKGIDSISEIPKERWDINQYFDTDSQVNNKTNSRFGGFIEDVDKFDPIFFNISPMEAELMDPQQRVFLEEAWNAVEDAGYSDSTLAEMKCGVFVGATHGDYRKIMERSGAGNHAYAFTGLNTFVLTGRVSYVLNITGPNMAIDTACSSSLVAISQACQSITDGDCEMAIAGGVRLMLEPDLHIQTSKLDMLSTDGKVRSFGKDAKGLVLSEGVGVVILKPVEKAIKDKDHIYGVIRAWGVNQDGKTNGITSPSAQSQEKLISGIYEKFSIRPELISYIEANGTASKLGDAIEIKALTDVFRKYTDKRNFCHIGTCKTNIGHSTMASGVAGVIKVLLSMKNKKIPGLLNLNHENEHIDLTQSPFIINTITKKWEPLMNEPLQAAVSSFGLSGTNCHIVISEGPLMAETAQSDGKAAFYLVPVSAKTETTLRDKLKSLLTWQMNENSNEAIENIAYTLTEGRCHFKFRAAMVVRDSKHLQEILKEVLEKGSSEHCFTYEPKDAKNTKDYLLEKMGQSILEEISSNLLSNEEYYEKLICLAQLYVKGYDLKFGTIYANKPARRISMPGYPFACNRYWVAASEKQAVGTSDLRLHPLVHKNISTLREQGYDTVFSGKEYYFTHHLVGGKKVLPAVVYLEMARAAATMALEEKVTSLKGVLWASPMVAEDGSVFANTVLFQGEQDIEFEICSCKSEQRVIHSQGKIKMGDKNILKPEFSIDDIAKRCREIHSGDDYYSRFTRNDLLFGESFHSIKEICIGENEAISELALPEHLKEEAGRFVLHPSIMNGAVETLVSLMGSSKEKVFMPLALEELNIWEEPGQICRAYVRCTGQNSQQAYGMRRFDLYLLDKSGQVMVGFKNFSVKAATK